ncbi:MAG: hypothetical protein Kow0037_02340 [Calditrichia bacterium]
MEGSNQKFGEDHRSRFFFVGSLVFLLMVAGAIYLLNKNWEQKPSINQQNSQPVPNMLETLSELVADTGFDLEEELADLKPIPISVKKVIKKDSTSGMRKKESMNIKEKKSNPDTLRASLPPPIDTTQIVENYLHYAEAAQRQRDYLANLHFLANAADLSSDPSIRQLSRERLSEAFSALRLLDNLPVAEGIAGLTTNSQKSLLLVWTKQNQIRIYNIKEQTWSIAAIRLPETIWEVKFSKEGNFFLVRTADKGVSVWRTDSGRKVCGPLKIDEGLAGARFGLQENYLIGWSMEGKILIWSALSGQILNEIKLEDAKIREILFDHKSESFFIATYDKKYYLFNIRNYLEPKRKELKLPFGEEILGGEFSFDSSLLLTWSKYGIQFWNTISGKIVGRPVEVEYGLLDGAHFSTDASHIVWWDKYRFIRIVRRGSTDLTFQPLYHQQPVQGAMFIKNNQWLVSWDNTGQLYTWNYFRNKLQSGPASLGQEINNVEFLPGLDFLLVTGKAGRGFLLNPLTYQMLGFPMVHAANEVESVSLADDSIFVTWAANDIAVKIWKYSDSRESVKKKIEDMLIPGRMSKAVTLFTGTILNQNGQALLIRPEVWQNLAGEMKINY